MKKKLNEFDLFECTQTELGLMMRVMDGWVVDGALIKDTITHANTEVEVYGSSAQYESSYVGTLQKILEEIDKCKIEQVSGAVRRDFVDMNLVNRIFENEGVFLDIPF